MVHTVARRRRALRVVRRVVLRLVLLRGACRAVRRVARLRVVVTGIKALCQEQDSTVRGSHTLRRQGVSARAYTDGLRLCAV